MLSMTICPSVAPAVAAAGAAAAVLEWGLGAADSKAGAPEAVIIGMPSMAGFGWKSAAVELASTRVGSKAPPPPPGMGPSTMASDPIGLINNPQEAGMGCISSTCGSVT